MDRAKVYYLAILWHLIWSQAVARREVFIKNNLKLNIESILLNCDEDFVKDCNVVPNNANMFRFSVTRQVDRFQLTINVKAIKPERIIFKLEYQNACRFLNNPFINKVFSRIYDEIVVNNTYFKCPIKPNIYYIHNQLTNNSMSFQHPAGRHRLSVRIIPALSKAPFVLEFIANYNIIS